MKPVTVHLDAIKVAMDFEPGLLAQLDGWRADRQIWQRSEAIRTMIEWAAAHDTTGRQKAVQPTDPILAQLDAFRVAHALLARTEAVKLAILTVLREPYPVGNTRPPNKRRRRQTVPMTRPKLVVDNSSS